MMKGPESTAKLIKRTDQAAPALLRADTRSHEAYLGPTACAIFVRRAFVDESITSHIAGMMPGEVHKRQKGGYVDSRMHDGTIL
jgi:hypothetical protein